MCSESRKTVELHVHLYQVKAPKNRWKVGGI